MMRSEARLELILRGIDASLGFARKEIKDILLCGGLEDNIQRILNKLEVAVELGNYHYLEFLGEQLSQSRKPKKGFNSALHRKRPAPRAYKKPVWEDEEEE